MGAHKNVGVMAKKLKGVEFSTDECMTTCCVIKTPVAV